MNRSLSDILYKTGLLEISGGTNISISSVAFDSRKVQPGSAFFAVKGTSADGHDFIDVAIENGAVAIICEHLPKKRREGISYARVNDTQAALGQAASNFFDNPSEKLSLVGVTGTNGKTTTATLLFEVFRSLGYGAGLLSTIENRIQDRVIPASHTTPDAIALNSLLHDMVTAGCEFAFMEVSSHAIAQERIHGLTFKGGIFTNLTHDHLDYHQNFRNYLNAKKKFFDQMPNKSFCLVNVDDPNGMTMVQNTKAKIFTYGLKTMADFKGRILESQFDGTKIDINGHEIWSQLIGQFNVYNFLAVFAASVLLEQEKEDILILLSQVTPVEGRFDCLRSTEGITAIVDYAHTPDAVQNVLKTISDLRTGAEKVITVIGAGGDRDKTKRPIMASIACQFSDTVILTSDNPRSEDPEQIIEDMRSGLDYIQKKRTISILNRREAILTACRLASGGDIILVAGKGHEKYQEVKGVRTPFDDKQILREALELYEQPNSH